jgi:hypothetical protein
MARKPRIPDEDAPDRQPATFGAVLGPFTMTVVPRPETTGRPTPEPEERWTLGPGRASTPDEGAAQAPDAPEGSEADGAG